MERKELIKITMLRDTWVDMEVAEGWLDVLLFPIFILMINCIAILGYPILIIKKIFASRGN